MAPTFRRLLLPGLTLAVVCGLLSGPLPGQEAKPDASTADGKSRSLFDGKSLGQWEVIEKYDFRLHGSVEVVDGQLELGAGDPATGVRYQGPFPGIDYELTLDAKRVEGDDFFAGITFPVGEDSLSLIVGGWNGEVVGLSCIDDEPAIENDTVYYQKFELDRWYHLRLRVTGERISVWIDKKQVIDLPTADRQLSLYWVQEPTLPVGIVTWNTKGAYRDIRVRSLPAK